MVCELVKWRRNLENSRLHRRQGNWSRWCRLREADWEGKRKKIATDFLSIGGGGGGGGGEGDEVRSCC